MSRITLITRCSFAVLLCFIALAGTAVRSNAQQVATSINIDFLPHKSGYPRGTQVVLAAHLQDCYGNPIFFTKVHFHTWVHSNGVRQEYDATTDINGNAYVTYTVPPVGFDKVEIESSYDGGKSFAFWYYTSCVSGWWRLPIGG